MDGVAHVSPALAAMALVDRWVTDGEGVVRLVVSHDPRGGFHRVLLAAYCVHACTGHCFAMHPPCIGTVDTSRRVVT
jgi:hypothetical protein